MTILVNQQLRALTVCVDYANIFQYAIQYNYHHFSEWMVVTTLRDEATLRLAEDNGLKIFTTDAFYRKGAEFNKYLAMEEALDVFGRFGWICLLDADVLWPKSAHLPSLVPGNIYGPTRRVLHKFSGTIPDESVWSSFHQHRNLSEWAGWTQIFHADDSHLGSPPWHETNWRHAGGGDSFFQRKWPTERKIRLPFEVLHLGPTGMNWCGRTEQGFSCLMKYMSLRRETRNFDAEKL